MSLLVLSLCDYSGTWSQPWADAGHRVVRVDMQHEPGSRQIAENVWTLNADVTQLDWIESPDVVLAAPPCTCFCRPGARWWKRQDESGQTAKDIATFRACLRLCRRAKFFWALENPPGRHQKLINELGPPAWQFHPFEFGDPWHKQTYIWGTAARPMATKIVQPPPTRRTPNGKKQGRIAFMSGTWKNERSETPRGFAKAFYEANKL